VAAIVLAGFTAFLSLYATQPLLPLFERVFAASPFTASLTVTATTLAVAVGAPLVGRAADLWGKRQVIVACAFVLALATFGAATSGSLASVIAWRFAQGLVTPGIFASAVAFVHDRRDPSRVGSAMAVYVSGTVVGGFTGRLISGQAASLFGWRASFVAIGALSLACAVILARRLPPERPRASRPAEGGRRGGRGSLRTHLTSRPLLGTYAAGFFVLFAQVAVFTYVAFYLAAAPFLLSTAALGWLYSVYLGGAVATPAAGRFIDLRGHRAALTLAMAIGVSGSLLTLGHALVAIVAGLALVSSGVFIAQAAANSFIGVAATEDRGLAVGLYATCYYIGGSVGGAVPSAFWATGGWPACVALVVAVQIVTAALGWRFWTGRPDGLRDQRA
jgi:MFS transporter, YNFM family, putative membrane transport protein